MTIFSKIIAGEIPAYTIAQNDLYYAFLDIFPVARGHVLVVPKEPVDKFFDLSDELLAGMLVFAKPIARSIEKNFPCNRVGISVIGLEVPHAHMHLIPINGIADMDFSKKLKLSSEEFTAIRDTIISGLE